MQNMKAEIHPIVLTEGEIARRADKYGRSVLRAMNQKPESCELFDNIIHAINNNAYLVLSEKFIFYAKGLLSIHSPKCTQRAPHQIISR